MEITTYCCDVGSTTRGRFAWVRLSGSEPTVRGGASISDCTDKIAADLERRRVVTLGFECPLFIPVPTTRNCPGGGRAGDGNRSCFAPAGGYVATLGLQQLAYLLRGVRQRVTRAVRARLDWMTWTRGDPDEVLLWEAFVSGPGHTRDGDHRRDAASAALRFSEMCRSGSISTSVSAAGPEVTFSLAGAAALWAGWAEDIGVLRQPVLVVKPEKPCSAAFVQDVEGE
jgi:hypothetical protein